jgi:tetratricopeptide (TPR) repeat protein
MGLLMVASGAQMACAGGPSPAAMTPVEHTGMPAMEISPKDFARVTAEVLASASRDQETKLRLAGITQYQLRRAERLFLAGHAEQAEDVVTGALLLLRHDDELLSATRERGVALLFAAHAAARSGDAGRAEALYDLAHKVLPSESDRVDVEQHLQAITEWNVSTGGTSDLEEVGEQARRAISRSIVDPRAESYTQAKNSIVDWMQKALERSDSEEAPASQMERELAMEAYRAIRTGAPAMIALNLRQGIPDSAVSALEEANLERALPPGVRALLNAASQENDSGAWLELFRQLESLRDQGSAETQLPRYLADGAALWAAIGLYRSSPDVVENVMPLSMTLVEFGMPEVASALLSKTTNEKSSGEALSWSVSLVLRGLLELSRSDQLVAARRSFQEAAPLFKLAERSGYRGPSPARAKMLMAALETRHGHVDRALPLLEASIALEENPGVYLRLAQLQRQQGKRDKALKSLKKSIELSQKAGDLLLESRAEETLFRIHRFAGEYPAAEAALGRALSRVLVLRDMEVPLRETAQVERQLAGLLEYYGRKQEVRRAYERALVASRNDLMELEVTLTDMARAALTLGDVRLARLATQSALDFGLPAENSIYIALWQQILEGRSGVARDGLSREVLTRASGASGWLGELRKFALGEIPPSELSSLASGIPERAEADFYALLSDKKKDRSLKEVAESSAVDLIEVRIAEDLVASSHAFPLPEGVSLP